MAITIRDIQAGGMTFRTREAGIPGGEPVLLLHGFPETSHMWVDLLPLLAEAGCHCFAPDQRGYSPGARPEGSENYQTHLLAADVIAIADAVGFTSRFHLIGHDWGAGVGWRTVLPYPDRIQSWTSLSIPHPTSYGRAYRDDPDQQQRSQYITYFQEPGVAEAAMSANDYERLKAIWSKSSPEEREEYIAVFTQPGALTAALNWYRGSFGSNQNVDEDGDTDVHVPTLTIWGSQDQAVGRSTTETAANYMKDYYRFLEMDAGHWLIQEKFAEVSQEILAHLKQFPIQRLGQGGHE